MATREQIAKVYVATFNRAADADGLAYWDGSGAVHTDLTEIHAIAAAMTDSAEYQAIYAGMDREATVTAMYQNLFNRAPDADGLTYWVSGEGSTVPINSMIIALIEGAQGDDVTVMDNKATVGLAFADAGLNDTTLAKTVMSGVTADPATVTAAESIITDHLPKTFTLTTGADTLTGGAGDDTFNGVSSSLVSEGTLQGNDVLDGGDGSDTLNVVMKSNFSGVSSTGAIKNIENVNLTNDTTITRTFDFKGTEGVTDITVNSAKGVNLSNLEKTGLNITEIGTQAATTIGFLSTVDLTGTSDAMALTLDGVGAAKTDTTAQVNPNITLAKIEDITIKTQNNDSFVNLAGVSEAKTLTITGDKSLTVTNTGTDITSVDATALTGDLDIDLTSVTATITNIQTGTGDDTVTVANNVQANATLAGNAGADTLELDGLGGTVQFTQSGFETLAITSLASNLTYSALNATDITTVNMVKDAAAKTANLVNMGAADITVNKVVDMVVGQDLTIDNSGTTTINIDATAAQQTASASATGATVTANGDVTLTKSSDVTVNLGKYVTYASTEVISASSASSVTLNVASGKNAATTPVELTSFNGTLNAAKATSVVVNADGILGAAAAINAAEATSVVLNTGVTASALTLNTAKATSLEVTAKGDLDLTAATLTKLQSFNATTDGKLDLTGLALADAANLTFSGTNAKSQLVSTGAIGTALLDHDISVTASGLKTGFTMDGAIKTTTNVTIDTSAVTGNQSIANTGNIVALNTTITTSGAAGNVDIGTVNSTGTGTGSATLHAAGNVGTVDFDSIGSVASFKTVTVDAKGALNTIGAATVADITATESVSVDVSDTLKAVKLGVITAQDVTVNAENALDTVALNDGANGTADIVAKKALTLTAGLKAVSADIGIDNGATTTITSFTGTLTGSIENDTLQFATMNNAASDITLTGDLGLGTDALVVTAVAQTSTATKIDISGLSNYDSATLTGGAIADTIIGGAGDDTITGGAGADSITLGAGADTVKLSAGDSAANGTVFDVINDFLTAGSDKVDLVSVTPTIVTNNTASSGVAAISSGGVATFNSADNTLAKHITAVEAGIQTGTAAAGQLAMWQEGSNAYVFISDGTDGVGANDIVIELVGVDTTATATDTISITGNTFTLA